MKIENDCMTSSILPSRAHYRSYLETLQFLATEAVNGQSGPFEAVSDVAEIRDPPQVDRNRVEADEESWKEEERHRHHRRQEHAVLHVHRGTDDETHRLRDERDQ